MARPGAYSRCRTICACRPPALAHRPCSHCGIGVSGARERPVGVGRDAHLVQDPHLRGQEGPRSACERWQVSLQNARWAGPPRHDRAAGRAAAPARRASMPSLQVHPHAPTPSQCSAVLTKSPLLPPLAASCSRPRRPLCPAVSCPRAALGPLPVPLTPSSPILTIMLAVSRCSSQRARMGNTNTLARVEMATPMTTFRMRYSPSFQSK